MDTTLGVPITEAATRLNLTVDAIRKRIQRGKLEATKGEDGLWYVQLDQTVLDGAGTDPDADQDRDAELIATLKDEVSWLRDSLRQERDSRIEAERRRDILFAQFNDQLTQLSSTATSVQEQVEAVAHEVVPEPAPPPGRLASWWHWLLTGVRP